MVQVHTELARKLSSIQFDADSLEKCTINYVKSDDENDENTLDKRNRVYRLQPEQKMFRFDSPQTHLMEISPRQKHSYKNDL